MLIDNPGIPDGAIYNYAEIRWLANRGIQGTKQYPESPIERDFYLDRLCVKVKADIEKEHRKALKAFKW